VNFEEYFQKATGYSPFPYQVRLAKSERLPDVINIPTGCGKTAAVILAWLWRRRFAEDKVRKETPRRLVYCLPMRVLVEQTRDNAISWLHNLELLGGTIYNDKKRVTGYEPSWDAPDKICVTVLMGGEDEDEWDRYPERDAIIIGTQDMLLSRALNRGYGMSRYRWPMHFGLLNNDCLWVMDEVQLMGVGVETSAQLDAFRRKFGVVGSAWSIWMSATLGQEHIETVDHPIPSGWASLSLENADLESYTLQKRVNAKKKVNKASIVLTKDNKNDLYANEVAKFVISKHKSDTLTLVIVNTVERAQAIYQSLLKEGRTEQDTAVLHSRFREPERKEILKLFEKTGDRIIVATQVVEAGMDVSAHTLITELAPWPSLVQRFGRCNRFAEHADAVIEWLDIDTSDEKETLALPYENAALSAARELISKIADASPVSLSTIKYESPNVVRPVIRRKDILDLFDTTPDLFGNDLDISNYIRDGDDKDVQVYWREIPDGGPSAAFSPPRREELCSVPVWHINEYLNKFGAWRWDPLEARWVSMGKGREVERARPGQVLLLDSNNGGYTPLLGWIGPTGKKIVPVPVIPSPLKEDVAESKMNDDDETYTGKWIPLATHLNSVSEVAAELSRNVGLSQSLQEVLTIAGRWHDVGKVHAAFQNMLISGQTDEAALRKGGPWAKSDAISQKGNYWVMDASGNRVLRTYFRHELASALAWLQKGGDRIENANLIAYLIAAHHGKVRMSIRSLPQETEPSEDILFARGIWQGDKLPNVAGVLNGEVDLDLSPMQMGEGSWLERVIRLLNDKELGPFRLALLETVLRAADWRASKQEVRE